MAQLVADLKAARNLIEKPENWCKGRMSRRNADGGYSYCAVGALDVATPDYQRFDRAGRYVESFIGDGDISEYNDAPRRTHKQILKLFDRAIARAEQP